jgi:hypothetical protein
MIAVRFDSGATQLTSGLVADGVRKWEAGCKQASIAGQTYYDVTII